MRTSPLIYGQGCSPATSLGNVAFKVLVAPVSRSEMTPHRMSARCAGSAPTSNVGLALHPASLPAGALNEYAKAHSDWTTDVEQLTGHPATFYKKLATAFHQLFRGG